MFTCITLCLGQAVCVLQQRAKQHNSTKEKLKGSQSKGK